MTIARACRPPTQELCRRLAGRWWIAQHPPSVLIPGFVIDTRNVATTAAGSPWHREREKRPTGPLGRAHPQPPPPKSTNASRHPPQGLGSHMIPAPVRSVPQTDRWCLQLLTSMQRGCDTDNPFVTKRPVAAGAGSGRVWRSRDCKRSCNTSEPKTRDTRRVLSNPPAACQSPA